MVRLLEVKEANEAWFGEENQKFFNDVDYWIGQSGSGKWYLCRSTYGFSDMFGRKRKLTYRLNPLSDELKIGRLLDDVFDDQDDVDDWLEEN